MSNEISIFIGGIGGQGAIRAAQILGKIVVEFKKLYAAMEVAYTSQTMGGPSKSELKISKSPIIYPYVEKIDYLIALHKWPLKNERVLKMLDKNSTIIYNSDVFQDSIEIEAKDIIPVPMTSIANSIGESRSVNMVALGVLVRYINDFVTLEDIEKALYVEFSEKIAKINIKALKEGYNIIKKK